MRYLLILLLLTGCSIHEYGERTLRINDKLDVVCYSHPQLSSDSYIKSGNTIGRLKHTFNGWEIHTQCDMMDGELFFRHPHVVGHEIQHLAEYEGAGDPDIIDKFRGQSLLEVLK